MKKRSLFAAVAMLIVSAILLTSSTYAWFQASHDATVDIVKGDASGSLEGNVLVKSATKDWSTSLAMSDLGFSADKELHPLDIDPTGGSVSTIKFADFDTQNFTVSNGNTTSYLTYSFQIKAVNAAEGAKISIPVNFTSGAFAYGVVEYDGNLVRDPSTDKVYIWGPSGNSYYSVGTCTKAVDGTGSNAGVIDSGEETSGQIASTATQVYMPADGEILIPALSTAKTITVYVWVEGQDTDCVGSGSVSDVGFQFGDSTTGIRIVSGS